MTTLPATSTRLMVLRHSVATRLATAIPPRVVMRSFCTFIAAPTQPSAPVRSVHNTTGNSNIAGAPLPVMLSPRGIIISLLATPTRLLANPTRCASATAYHRHAPLSLASVGVATGNRVAVNVVIDEDRPARHWYLFSSERFKKDINADGQGQ